MVALGSASIICFPLLGSISESDHESDFETINSTTSNCVVRHLFGLWVGLFWNSHHFSVSLFIFVVKLFSYGFDGFSWVTLPWLCPLFCGLGASFPRLRFTDPFLFLLLKFFLDLDSVLVHCTKRVDVHELHFGLDIIMQISTVLEY